jgi:hypothetical protein
MVAERKLKKKMDEDKAKAQRRKDKETTHPGRASSVHTKKKYLPRRSWGGYGRQKQN